MSNISRLELFKNRIEEAKSIKQRNAFLAENSIMSDFKFIVGPEKKEVPAHKHIFASTSYEFFNLFYLSSPTDVNISLPDIKYESFKEFIRYVYSDDINIETDNFFEILTLSLRYNMDHLTGLCLNELPTFNNEFNATFMDFFEVWNNEKTIDSFLVIIGRNPLEYINQGNVERLKFEHLNIILESKETETSEIDYFRLAMIWAKKKCILMKKKPIPSMKRVLLKHLIFLIGFPTMTLDEFKECSKGQTGLFTNEEIIQIILFIKNNGEGETDFCEEKRIRFIFIYVQTLTGKNVRIRKLNAFSSVEDIKQSIWKLEGYPVSDQRLILEGRQLEDHRQIEELNIKNNSTLHLVLRLRA